MTPPTPGHTIDPERLVHRIKGTHLKALVTRLVEPLVALGYKTFSSKAPNYIARHDILTIHLSEDVCAKCNDPTKFTWQIRHNQLTKGCGKYSCPADIYSVDDQSSGDGSITLHHEGHVDVRQKISKPCPTEIRHSPLFNESGMLPAALDHGMKLARVIKAQNASFRHFPTDVHDGKHWWWWSSDDYCWHMDPSGTHIHKTIETTIVRDYGQFKMAVNTPQCDQAVNNLLKKVNTRLFRDTLAKDCAITFRDDKFRSQLDSKQHLICCANGVYDLDKCEFREGTPGDYLTHSTHRTFLGTDQASSLHLGECQQFIKDVLVDDEIIDMMMSAMCKSLHGCTQLNKFFLWVGCGSNGKSKLASLFRLALGDYSIAIPVTVFTQKRIEYGKACPELQRTQGRRVVFISEPSHNETLNLGIVKEVTGGDAMYTRGLYEDGGEMQCVFPLSFFCVARVERWIHTLCGLC